MPPSVNGPLSGEVMIVGSGIHFTPIRGTPHPSAIRPQVSEAEGDEFADHGGAAGFVEAGFAQGIDCLDHRQREAGLDEFQTLVRWFRWPAASALGR